MTTLSLSRFTSALRAAFDAQTSASGRITRCIFDAARRANPTQYDDILNVVAMLSREHGLKVGQQRSNAARVLYAPMEVIETYWQQYELSGWVSMAHLLRRDQPSAQDFPPLSSRGRRAGQGAGKSTKTKDAKTDAPDYRLVVPMYRHLRDLQQQVMPVLKYVPHKGATLEPVPTALLNEVRVHLGNALAALRKLVDAGSAPDPEKTKQI